MKASNHYSFSYKLCMALQTFVALIFIALFLSLYSYSESAMTDSCDQRVEMKRNRIQLKVAKELNDVELCADLLAKVLFYNGSKLPSEETVRQHLEIFLKTTREHVPSITGVVAGFEDEVYPKCQAPWGYIPLVRSVDSSLVYYQMGEVRDVRHVNDWYAGTKALDHPRWSKVMMSEDGEPICNYSIPLHDAEGNFIGVMAVDLSLSFLTDDIYESLPFPNTNITIVDSSHTYLVHPDLSYVMNKTSFDYLKELGFPYEPAVMEEINNRQPGKRHYTMDTPKGFRDVFFYYAPIDETDWTLQMEMPADAAYKDLSAMRSRMILTGVVGLLLVLLVALTFARFRN